MSFSLAIPSRNGEVLTYRVDMTDVQAKGEHEALTAQAVTLLLFIVCAGILMTVYARQRRWYGAFGWTLLLGGQVFLALGGGDWFAWGGLAGLFVSGFGIVMIVMDLVLRRRAPRR